jgi:hypothetical protein
MLFNPGLPFSSPSFQLPLGIANKPAHQPKKEDLLPPEAGLPRVVHYNADYSGCGMYRMSWVGHLLNAHQKAMVQESTVMIIDPRWYVNTKAIRIQRQATPHQLQFIQFLKSIQKDFGFKLIYEVDDIIFREDIPDYNKFKFAFESDEIRQTSVDIIKLCDEVSVTNDFMKQYYQEKCNKQEVTVIPNFIPRWWMGNYYNLAKISNNFTQNRKRPRILYAGSGAHFDVDNRTNHRDDFEHVIKAIIDTRFKFKWVFLGAFPLPLRPYIENGDLEFHPWQRFYDYPKKIDDLNIQMLVAPLQNNNFNKGKSDLKYIEACCYGLPVACQDMCTYSNAEIKFNTGDEMIHCIENNLKSLSDYRDKSYHRRKVAENRFLENDDNIGCYTDLYLHPYGSPERTNINRYNGH